MIAHPSPCWTALVLALMLPTSASAGSTATRCDAHGCTHIHCNPTGDRCYRYGHYEARRGSQACTGCGGASRAHAHSIEVENAADRVCDSAGDRCYTSPGGHWNYREYYRRHGYHWDN